MANGTPFPYDPHLTSIAIAVKPTGMIADEVLPRLGVGKQDFKWRFYDLKQGFNVPDTRVGRRGVPNEVTFTGEERTDSTVDYGLDAKVPNDDITNAAGTQFDPLGEAVEGTSLLIDLGREVRVSNTVFNTANYDADKVEVLASGNKFSDSSSDPLAILDEALDAPLMRPNTIVLGRTAWKSLRRHPKVVSAVYKNSGTSGLVSAADLAEILEVEKILVGKARVDTTNKGQPLNLQTAWGPHCALLYINTTRDQATWGWTAEWQNKLATQRPDPDIGLRGGIKARVGESLRELVSAPSLGYYLPDCAA